MSILGNSGGVGYVLCLVSVPGRTQLLVLAASVIVWFIYFWNHR